MDDAVPRARLDDCHDAIDHWRHWAMLWCAIATVQYVVIIGYAGGWW